MTGTQLHILDIAAAVITILTAAFLIKQVIAPTIKTIRNFFRTASQFLEDWSGTEARPGHPAVPGVMERLNNIDGQLKNNGGSTIKDAVDRIEKRLSSIDGRLNVGEERFLEIENEVDRTLQDIHALRHVVDRRWHTVPVEHDRRDDPFISDTDSKHEQ